MSTFLANIISTNKVKTQTLSRKKVAENSVVKKAFCKMAAFALIFF